MTPFPLDLGQLGSFGQYLIYLLIGVGFGIALEMSGFAISTRLAAQFYLKDMTVLKVMFTGIIVAMVLIFGASAIGLLDYNVIWVNPTYLVPGIVGGLIMGVGFIIGGFCPGTSIVAAVTGKLDGVFFVLGAFVGIFLFGETVGLYPIFFNSTNMGRFTLQDLFQVEAGVVVFGVVIFALIAFAFAELMERTFGDKAQKAEKAPKWRFGAAGALVLMSAGVMAIGQPTNETRWASIAPEKLPLLEERAVQVSGAEVRDLLYNDRLKPYLIDVRSEADYNLFHILDSVHIPLDKLLAEVPRLRLQKANTVFILISNDETLATEAWRILSAESVPNVYILDGGINKWIKTFGDEAFFIANPPKQGMDDTLKYDFKLALGSRYIASYPDSKHPELEYESKIKIELQRGGKAGGCG